MKVLTYVNEPRRGCGYRKAGGLYLVRGGGEQIRCGRLPMPLSVCPCCGQGIKPARGWTWVDGMLLKTKAAAQPCDQVQGYCGGCMVNPINIPERVGLIWVGDAHYSPDEFNEEALRVGISRRIGALPTGFVAGETHVWLAHRKAIKKKCAACSGTGITWAMDPATAREQEYRCEECEGIGDVESPGVFQAFIPSCIEYVLTGQESEEELARMVARGITPVRVVRTDGADSDD